MFFPQSFCFFLMLACREERLSSPSSLPSPPSPSPPPPPSLSPQPLWLPPWSSEEPSSCDCFRNRSLRLPLGLAYPPAIVLFSVVSMVASGSGRSPRPWLFKRSLPFLVGVDDGTSAWTKGMPSCTSSSSDSVALLTESARLGHSLGVGEALWKCFPKLSTRCVWGPPGLEACSVDCGIRRMRSLSRRPFWSGASGE